MAPHHGHQCAGIETTGEEDAQGHVADEMAFDGLVEQLAFPLHGGLVGERLYGGRHAEVPVLLDVELAVFPDGQMSGG